MKKLIALLLAAVMMLGLLAGCNGSGDETKPSQDAQPTGGAEATQGTQGNEGTGSAVADRPNAERYGGHLNVAVAATINNIDPYKQTNVWRYMWTGCVFENALTRDPDHNIQPGVCDFEISDDYLTVKLWVREGKVFHDGTPVEIEDVKASIDRACGGLFPSGKNYIAAYLESSTIEGDVLTLKFKSYNERTLYYLASYQTWLGIIPKEICEKYGQEIITNISDVIGTGPYKIMDWEQDMLVTVTRFDDYVVMDEDKHGYAGPKYAYMDTISFHYFMDYSSAAIALMSGDYDVLDDMDDEVKESAAGLGLVETLHESNTGCSIIFNTFGNGVCARYPSMRKAVVAAIDMYEYNEVRYGEGGFEVQGSFVKDNDFNGDILEGADYFGEQKLDVVAKYLEQAKQEGWDGVEPIKLVWAAGNDIDTVMIPKYLKEANIPYSQSVLESTAATEITSSPTGAWDVRITFPTMTFTPTGTTVDFITTNYNSPAKDEILKQMNTVALGSDAYMKLWDDLQTQMVEDCMAVNMGFIVWSWHHPETLQINDEGVARYFFNSYWTDPENHTM